MMKKRMIQIGAVVFFALTLFLGCRSQNEKEEKEPIEAMYIQKGEDFQIFIDTKNQSPFFAPIPEGTSPLSTGDLVEVYGNGIMLESYPGQYPGVTRILLKAEGEEKDADKYEELLREIYQEPDPSIPPYLGLEYRTKEAVVHAAATMGSYEWSWNLENGERQTATADTAPIQSWTELADINLKEPVDIKLDFSEQAEEVKVTCFQTEDSGDEGESVRVREKEGEWILESLQKPGIYQVQAKFEQGKVEYGFLLQNK